jgi:uncharacterized protein
MSRLLEPYARQWAVLLSTRKRDGTTVPTPVNLAVDRGDDGQAGDIAWFSTAASTGKVKRLRNFPEVEIRPCSLRGKPTGPALIGRARRLEGAEVEVAAAAMRRKYPIVHGLTVPVELRIRRTHGLYYELSDVRAAD